MQNKIYLYLRVKRRAWGPSIQVQGECREGPRRVQGGSREGSREGAARQLGTWSAPWGDISKEEEKKKSYDERWGKKKRKKRQRRRS